MPQLAMLNINHINPQRYSLLRVATISSAFTIVRTLDSLIKLQQLWLAPQEYR